MPKDMRQKPERRPNMKLGKFGAYLCPHCPDSQMFNTQTAYQEHEAQHIEFVKSGGTYGDFHLSGNVEYIEPMPDKRAPREVAKAMGRNPNLVPMGNRHKAEERDARPDNLLLQPDYLPNPGSEQGCSMPPQGWAQEGEVEHVNTKPEDPDNLTNKPKKKPKQDTTAAVPKLKMLQLDCKQGAVRAVRLSVDGMYMMTCGSDKSLKLWNPRKGTQLKTYMGHGFEVLDAMGSCDNSQIVSCGSDKTVVLWDVSSGQWNRKWRGHLSSVNCVRFNEDSSVVVSGSVDTTVKVWDCRSRSQEPIQTLDECKDTVTSLDISAHEILVGSGDGRVRMYDLRAGSLLTDTLGGSVSSVNFTRDGECILASSVGQPLRLIDKKNGELLSEFKGHLNKEYKLDSRLDHTDQMVISGSEDGKVYLWDLVTGEVVGALEHGQGSGTVHSLATHPSKSMLVSGQRGSVTVWQDREDALEEEVEPTLSSANAFDFPPHWLEKHPKAVR